MLRVTARDRRNQPYLARGELPATRGVKSIPFHRGVKFAREFHAGILESQCIQGNQPPAEGLLLRKRPTKGTRVLRSWCFSAAACASTAGNYVR
jgi:hypothetical protein